MQEPLDFNADLFAVFEILLFTDFHQTLLLDLVGQGFEAEFRTARSQGLDDSATSRNRHEVKTLKSTK